jgi:hypothetical protein
MEAGCFPEAVDWYGDWRAEQEGGREKEKKAGENGAGQSLLTVVRSSSPCFLVCQMRMRKAYDGSREYFAYTALSVYYC